MENGQKDGYRVENTWHLSRCFSVILFHPAGRDHQVLKKQKIFVVFSCLIFPILKVNYFVAIVSLFIWMDIHYRVENTWHLSCCFSVIIFHSKGRDHQELKNKNIFVVFFSHFSKMRSQKNLFKFISKFVSLIVWKTNNICHVVSGI